MISSKHPVFAKLATKLDRAGQELGRIDSYLDSIKDSGRPVNEWPRGSALALMLNLANDIDGHVPAGETLHQDLLDQMSAAIEGKRPAMLDPRLYGMLVELKGFRHVVGHRYGFDLDQSRVDENVARIREAFPAFVSAVRDLERAMTAEDTGEAEPSGSTSRS